MYKCKFCGKEFFFEGKLKRHLLFNHPNEPEDSDLYLRIRDEVLATTREQAATSSAEIVTVYMSNYSSVHWIPNSVTVEDLSAEW